MENSLNYIFYQGSQEEMIFNGSFKGEFMVEINKNDFDLSVNLFELTPEGIKRSVDVDPQESITRETAGSLNKVITALLCAAVAILLADKFLDFGSLLAPPATEIDTAAEVEMVAQPAPTPVEEDSKPRSIAVLPFVNMSDDSGQEYFSDGISEELLNVLVRVSELEVASRTSSFAYKGKDLPLVQLLQQDFGAPRMVHVVPF